MKPFYAILLIYAFLSSSFNQIGQHTIYVINALSEASQQERTVSSFDTWAGYSQLERISACESTGSPTGTPIQYLPNGTVLRGTINPNDIGELQINAPLWQKTAEKLGWNIYKESGNIAMGKWIYNKYGSKPWHWSKHCWDKDN